MQLEYSVQWGTKYTATDTEIQIVYPIAFSSVYIVVLGISSTGDYRSDKAWSAKYKSNTGFTATSPGDMSLLSADWIALGK